MLRCSSRLGREVSSPSSRMGRQPGSTPGPPAAEGEIMSLNDVVAK